MIFWLPISGSRLVIFDRGKIFLIEKKSLRILSQLDILPVNMSGRALGKLWPFFHKGELQNSSHYKAFCNGCIEDKLALEPPDPTKEQKFKAGEIHSLILPLIILRKHGQ